MFQESPTIFEGYKDLIVIYTTEQVLFGLLRATGGIEPRQSMNKYISRMKSRLYILISIAREIDKQCLRSFPWIPRRIYPETVKRLKQWYAYQSPKG